MSQRITELADDRVMIQIKSKRGTGTRDQDEVTVQGFYEDIDEAEAESHRLNELLAERMREARELSTDEPEDDGAAQQSAAAATTHQPKDTATTQQSKNAGTAQQSTESDSTSDTTKQPDSSRSADVSKVYLGDGADTSGWIPVETELVEEEIVPLVETYRTDREDIETISVNFSSDISASGWTKVDAGVVTRSIQPIVQEHRLDTS